MNPRFCCCFYNATNPKLHQEFFLVNTLFIFLIAVWCLNGRILAKNLPWNWSMKFHLSRLRVGLLPAKEVIWVSFLFQKFNIISSWKCAFDNIYCFHLPLKNKVITASVTSLNLCKNALIYSGADTPALGHPIEFICLDMNEPAVCKYCGLRYVQDHHH